jgi:hypothetical protein
MSFLDSLRKNLTPELYTQVTDQLGDDFDFDLVPRSRLNKVIKQRNDLRDQLSGASQPPAEPPTAPVSDDGDDPLPASQPDIENLKKQWLKEQGDAVNKVRKQFAVLDKLRQANAIDPDLIWQAGLLDTNKMTVAEDGSVSGIDELIESLKKSRAVLFAAPSTPPTGTGKEGGDDGFKGVTTKADFLKLPTDKQLEFKKANPETFQKFLQE